VAVLVLGGYGLIGAAVVGRLREAGIAVIGLGRRTADARRRFPDVEWRTADIARLRTPADWAPLLRGVEVVVNAAGVLQDGLNDKVAAVQDTAMRALYAAASVASVRRIVQVSAVGAAQSASTEFLRSKARADAALAASGLDFVILRPALVIAPHAYGGTALLRGLAAIPYVTPLVFADSLVQTAWIGDVADAVLAATMGTIAAGVTADLAEPTPRTLAETVRLFRAWLGEAPARQLRLPAVGAGLAATISDLLGWLGWRSPLRRTAMTVMAGGVLADPEAGSRLLGRPLRGLPESLAAVPVGAQELWFARLWLAKPALIAVLSAFWLTSGAVGLLRASAAVAVLTTRGVAPRLATALVFAGAFADLALGAAVLLRPLAGAALKGMVLVSLAYLVGATALAPDLWMDPLGPLVKVVPALTLAVVALAVLEER
jgi:uncharacterized protein YbjT (DUF2867 family)